jgi:hypothetical protein
VDGRSRTRGADSVSRCARGADALSPSPSWRLRRSARLGRFFEMPSRVNRYAPAISPPPLLPEAPLRCQGQRTSGQSEVDAFSGTTVRRTEPVQRKCWHCRKNDTGNDAGFSVLGPKTRVAGRAPAAVAAALHFVGYTQTRRDVCARVCRPLPSEGATVAGTGGKDARPRLPLHESAPCVRHGPANSHAIPQRRAIALWPQKRPRLLL